MEIFLPYNTNQAQDLVLKAKPFRVQPFSPQATLSNTNNEMMSTLFDNDLPNSRNKSNLLTEHMNTERSIIEEQTNRHLQKHHKTK